MFPRNLPFAGDVVAQWALEAIAMHPSRGRGYTRSRYQTRALIEALSEVIDDDQGDTWTNLDAAMTFDRKKPHNHEIVPHYHLIGGNPRLQLRRGHMISVRSSSSGSRLRRMWTASWATIPTTSHDRTAQITL